MVLDLKLFRSQQDKKKCTSDGNMSVVSPSNSSNMSSTGGGSSGSSDGLVKQKCAINSQQVLYHEEFNRMRERLFRILSKVPIQVETNGTSQGQEEGKGASKRCKVIDREPVTIKYYNQRSLAEILELHFSCSLIKHNFSAHAMSSEHSANTSYIGAPMQHQQQVQQQHLVVSNSGGWQLEENQLGYTSLTGNHLNPTRSQQPVDQYHPPTRVYHTTPEVLPNQSWHSNVDAQSDKSGSYKTSNDGCSLELGDGQRHSSPASRQAGSTSSLAQGKEKNKIEMWEVWMLSLELLLVLIAAYSCASLVWF